MVIPVTVLLTLVGMRIFHMSFNLMTLGGIAAAIGLVIDDAIVVVEAIYAKVAGRACAVRGGRIGDSRSRLPPWSAAPSRRSWSSSRWPSSTAWPASSSAPWR